MARYRPKPIETLETRRLLLRPVVSSDAGRVQELFDNIEVLKYMSTAIPWPYPETGAKDFLEAMLPKMQLGEKYFWAILEKENIPQGLIGMVGLTPDSHEDSRGFWLGEPYWKRGYMSEACATVTDFAFDELEMEELFLGNAEPNFASHRLKEKAGAEILSIEDTDYIGGRFPGVRWRLTKQAWQQNRDRFCLP
jgi:RimJ/RimL family protein N-acetyltransferase